MDERRGKNYADLLLRRKYVMMVRGIENVREIRVMSEYYKKYWKKLK